MIISLLNFNIWDIPLLSPNPERRIKFIAREISRLNPDIILLQEAWRKHAHKTLCSTLYYKYKAFCRKYFPPVSLWGSGLITFSHFPIISSDFIPFKKKTRITEALSKKGILYTRILAGKQEIIVINTHFGEGIKAQKRRILQLLQLRKFLTDEKESLIIIGGDFNFTESSEEYAFLTETCNLTDVYRTLHPDKNGYTVDHDNQNFAGGLFSDEPDSRIDFLFLNSSRINPVGCDVIYKEALFDNVCLSDHYALYSKLEL